MLAYCQRLLSDEDLDVHKAYGAYGTKKLYGKEVDRVERAIKAIEKDIGPGARGERELVIGKAAVGLARLYALDLQAGAALLALAFADELLGVLQGREPSYRAPEDAIALGKEG